MTNPKYYQGMTLVELMIVVAIVAVLAVVVYPVYTNHLTKVRRSDAKISLTELAQLEENFYVTGNVYTTSFSTLLGLSGSQTEKYGFEVQSGNLLKSKESHYQISSSQTINSSSGNNISLNRSFTLRAVPEPGGKQANDTDCKLFEITATGAKTAWDAAGNESDDCW